MTVGWYSTGRAGRMRRGRYSVYLRKGKRCSPTGGCNEVAGGDGESAVLWIKGSGMAVVVGIRG